MYNAIDFIRWALTHVHRSSIPSGAELALPADECGAEPWEYLFGSIRVKTDDANLNRYFDSYYKNVMTRSEYDRITAGWDRNGYATDCQGLLDAWLTYEMNDPTDINADGNYRLWCTEKARIGETVRPFIIGEAVFKENAQQRMTHVGWICGFIGTEPLVAEARSIRYGVVVSPLYSRSFTHRGLMDRKFSYGGSFMEPIRLEYRNPMMRGDEILAIQFALNRLGYVGRNGEKLTEDGKLGRNTMFAIDEFVRIQSAGRDSGPVFRIPDESGEFSLKISVEKSDGE